MSKSQATRSIKVIRLADRPTSGQTIVVWQMDSVPNDIASLTFSIRSSHDSAALGVIIESHFDPLSLAAPTYTAVQAGVTYSAAAGLTTYEIQRIGVGMRVRFVNSANLPTTWEGEIRGHYQRKQFAGPTGPTGASGAVTLRTSVLTSGTTLAKAGGATSARIRAWGAGGGGGGATYASGTTIVAAGGGAAGAPVEFFTSTLPANWTFAIGAAGTAGASSGGNGGNGGSTTISNGVVTVTAPGGGGGVGVDAAGNTTGTGGAPTTASNGSVNGSGMPGSNGVVSTSSVLGNNGGNGGSSSVGGAGRGGLIQAAGTAATGFAAGGGGAASNSGGFAGGVGTAGLIILEEFG